MKRRVLVTGAAGTLGQDIVKSFRRAGFDVIATTHRELDITNAVEVGAAITKYIPEIVVNTAAYNAVDKIEDPTEYPKAFAINVIGPKNLAEACAKIGALFIHYSSDYVFAGDKQDGYIESDIPDPKSKYGETKVLGEKAVEKTGCRFYICRLSKVFGIPGSSESSKPSFVSLMLKLAAEKPELQINDAEVATPGYSYDIAEATLGMAFDERPSGYYHLINSGPAVTWYGFAEEIFAEAGVKTPRKAVPTTALPPRPAPRPAYSALLNTKLPPLPSRASALRHFLTRPRISIVICTLQVRDLLHANLQRLTTLKSAVPFEIIVTDNGSTDGTSKMIRQEFPNVILIQNDFNSGFGHACNQGLAFAQGDIVLFFNPDMLLNEGVLEKTYEVLMAKQEIGAMSVKLVTEDGTPVRSVRRDPSFTDQLAILLKLPHFFPGMVSRYHANDFDYNVSQPIEQVRGAYIAIRRDVIDRIGAFDEKNFFVWYEDIDLCKRIRLAGYTIWYEASVSCIDYVGQTFKQQHATIKQIRFTRSMAKYFFKWHPFWQGVVITVLRPFAITAAWISDLWRK